MTTPISPEVRARFAAMPAPIAVVTAWVAPGNNPAWHREQQDEVRRRMPLLAEALDRLARGQR